MDIVNPSTVRTEFNMEEIHAISVGLLRFMEDDDIDVGSGCVALCLTIGRLIAPRLPLTQDEEVGFIKAAMEWAGMYWAGGGRPN